MLCKNIYILVFSLMVTNNEKSYDDIPEQFDEYLIDDDNRFPRDDLSLSESREMIKKYVENPNSELSYPKRKEWWLSKSDIETEIMDVIWKDENGWSWAKLYIAAHKVVTKMEKMILNSVYIPWRAIDNPSINKIMELRGLISKMCSEWNENNRKPNINDIKKCVDAVEKAENYTLKSFNLLEAQNISFDINSLNLGVTCSCDDNGRISFKKSLNGCSIDSLSRILFWLVGRSEKYKDLNSGDIVEGFTSVQEIDRKDNRYILDYSGASDALKKQLKDKLGVDSDKCFTWVIYKNSNRDTVYEVDGKKYIMDDLPIGNWVTLQEVVVRRYEILDKYVSEVKSTWEYNVYKLNLGNPVGPVKNHIKKALDKIPTFWLSEIFDDYNSFEAIMPMIIKESMMNGNAKSKSWAVGYLQLMPVAVQDTKSYYSIYGISDLDVNNPVDNIILWILYRKRVLDQIKSWLESVSFSDSDLNKMMLISYNAWPTFIIKLFKESGAINYQEFEKFLVEKICGKNCYEPTEIWDSTYNVEYLDPLGGLDYDELVIKSKDVSNNKRIIEWLRYVAIIDSISWYVKNDETMQIVWTIQLNKNTTLFSEVKKLKDNWFFKQGVSLDKICKIILDSNWYSENNIPKSVDLYIIYDVIKDYLL